MPLTAEMIADEFLAAMAAAGLKKVMVLTGKIAVGEYVVTLAMFDPTAPSLDAQYLVSSAPHEFVDREHVKETATERAAMLARVIPTIH